MHVGLMPVDRRYGVGWPEHFQRRHGSGQDDRAELARRPHDQRHYVWRGTSLGPSRADRSAPPLPARRLARQRADVLPSVVPAWLTCEEQIRFNGYLPPKKFGVISG